MPPEPVIIYKATPLPSDQKRTNAENAATGTKHTHVNEHPHDNTPDTYISDDTSNDEIYDWREDNGVDSPSTEEDPRKQAYIQKTEEKYKKQRNNRSIVEMIEHPLPKTGTRQKIQCYMLNIFELNSSSSSETSHKSTSL